MCNTVQIMYIYEYLKKTKIKKKNFWIWYALKPIVLLFFPIIDNAKYVKRRKFLVLATVHL